MLKENVKEWLINNGYVINRHNNDYLNAWLFMNNRNFISGYPVFHKNFGWFTITKKLGQVLVDKDTFKKGSNSYQEAIEQSINFIITNNKL